MSAPVDMRLPPEEFYWAAIDADRLRTPRWMRARRRRRLGCLFEDALPLPIEEVHAVYIPIEGGRILACGMERAALDGGAFGDAGGLGPEAVPEFLGTAVDASRINLLSGSYLPARARRLRSWAGNAIVAAAVLMAVAFVGGVERRIVAARARAAEASRLVDVMYGEVLPAAAPNAQPTSIRLTSELRTLRLTRGGSSAEGPAADVTADLAALFAAWPADLRVRTESMIVSPDAATITAVVGTHADAQALADALWRASGWAIEQPQSSAVREGVRVTLRLKKGVRS